MGKKNFVKYEGKKYKANKEGKLMLYDIDLPDMNHLLGLEEIEGVTELVLSHNSISSFKKVENLTSLKTLYAVNNNLETLDGLENCNNLEKLVLFENQIADIKAIEGLTNLTWLDLKSNKVTDISPLANLKKLVNLNLYDNEIKDISVLQYLPNLILSQLELGQNYLPKELLDNLYKVGLKKFFADDNIIRKEILGKREERDAKLAAMPDHVVFRGEKIFINRDNLSIQLNRIGLQSLYDVENLTEMVHLKELYLVDNEIVMISGLEKLRDLEVLDFRNNEVVALQSLENMTNLELLRYSGNPIAMWLERKFSPRIENDPQPLVEFLKKTDFEDFRKEQMDASQELIDINIAREAALRKAQEETEAMERKRLAAQPQEHQCPECEGYKRCQKCFGTGYDETPCDKCDEGIARKNSSFTSYDTIGNMKTTYVTKKGGSCPECGGTGFKNALWRKLKTCPRCNGTKECPTCNGRGIVIE